MNLLGGEKRILAERVSVDWNADTDRMLFWESYDEAHGLGRGEPVGCGVCGSQGPAVEAWDAGSVVCCE